MTAERRDTICSITDFFANVNTYFATEEKITLNNQNTFDEFVHNALKIDHFREVVPARNGFWLTFHLFYIKIERSITEETTSGNQRRHIK